MPVDRAQQTATFQFAIPVQQAVKEIAEVMQMGKIDDLHAAPSPVVKYFSPSSAVVAVPAPFVHHFAIVLHMNCIAPAPTIF